MGFCLAAGWSGGGFWGDSSQRRVIIGDLLFFCRVFPFGGRRECRIIRAILAIIARRWLTVDKPAWPVTTLSIYLDR
jgi:hypothetical protein